MTNPFNRYIKWSNAVSYSSLLWGENKVIKRFSVFFNFKAFLFTRYPSLIGLSVHKNEMRKNCCTSIYLLLFLFISSSLYVFLYFWKHWMNFAYISQCVSVAIIPNYRYPKCCIHFKVERPLKCCNHSKVHRPLRNVAIISK